MAIIQPARADILRKALQFCAMPTFCVLSTIDNDGFPQARMMVNLRSDDEFAHRAKYFKSNRFDTYFCTHLSTEKIEQIRKNPKCSIYYTQAHDGLLLIGDAEIIEDDGVRCNFWESNFQWNMYYKDKNDPEYTVIKFTAKRIKFYYELNNYMADL